MTTEGKSRLDHHLQAWSDDLASAWYEAVARTGFVSGDDTSLRRQLGAVTERIVALLTTEPFPGKEAERVGAGLSRLRCVQPEVVEHMLEELAQRLVIRLPSEDLIAIQPRLSVLTIQIMAGFAREEAARIAAEQGAIHQAMAAAQRQAEAALRASENRYQAVVTQAGEGVILADARTGRVLETNIAFQQLFGYTPVEAAELYLHQLVAHDRASVDQNIRHALRTGRHEVAERQCVRKDGTFLIVEASITAIQTANGTLLCSVVRDVTERTRAVADMARTRRRLAQGREAERLRLAQELHDGPVQELLALHLHLSAAAGEVERGRLPSETLPKFGYIDARLMGLAGDLRQVVAELRPCGLEDFGLQGALEHSLTRLRMPGGIGPAVAFGIDRGAGTLPRTTMFCLFRIAQEAMRNAFLHAQARNVVIRLHLRNRNVILRVGDDGHGFVVPERLSMPAVGNHFGLSGMAERVELAEGRLRVRSRAGKGTTVTVWLPIPEEAMRKGDENPDPAGG